MQLLCEHYENYMFISLTNSPEKRLLFDGTIVYLVKNGGIGISGVVFCGLSPPFSCTLEALHTLIL